MGPNWPNRRERKTIFTELPLYGRERKRWARLSSAGRQRKIAPATGLVLYRHTSLDGSVVRTGCGSQERRRWGTVDGVGWTACTSYVVRLAIHGVPRYPSQMRPPYSCTPFELIRQAGERGGGACPRRWGCSGTDGLQRTASRLQLAQACKLCILECVLSTRVHKHTSAGNTKFT